MKFAGFTLIELLVVIAVIALVIAVSAPSLQNSRQHAKAVLCSSNIRQLVFGLAMYETDNQTFPYGYHFSLTPPPGGYPGYFQYDRPGWWWFNYITDYSTNDSDKDSIIWCPSRKVKNTKLKNNVLCGNYGVNQFICKSSRGHAEFVGIPLSSGDIQRPSETLLMVDSGYSMITWWHATDTPPTPLSNTIIEDTAYIPGLGLLINRERTLWLSQEWDAKDGRHPNKTVNVGFADGHVSPTRADELFVEKTNDSYKNRVPLWLPK